MLYPSSIYSTEKLTYICALVMTWVPICYRECPADLKEGIASVIFAAPRCSEIPELGAIRDIFEKKYGKDFVSAATDLRPNSGVNRMVLKDFQLFQICWTLFDIHSLNLGF